MARSIHIEGISYPVRLGNFSFAESARNGEVGQGGMDVDSENAAFDINPHWDVMVRDTDDGNKILYRGWVGDRTIARGPFAVNLDRKFDLDLVDINTMLGDRVIRIASGKRPAETDIQRVDWLSTIPAMDGEFIFNVGAGGSVNMDKNDYRGRYARDVLTDCAEQAGKMFFAYWDPDTNQRKVFYDLATAANWTSSFAISTVLAESSNSSVFEPRDIQRRLDGGRIYSGIQVKWAGGTEFVQDTSISSNYRRREISIYDDRVKSAAKARARGEKYLAASAAEEEVITCEVDVTSADIASGFLAGQRVSIKAPHLGIPSPVYRRLVHREVKPKGEGDNPDSQDYTVVMELSNPKTVRWSNFGTPAPENDASSGTGGGPTGGTGTPSCISTFVDPFERITTNDWGVFPNMTAGTYTWLDGGAEVRTNVWISNQDDDPAQFGAWYFTDGDYGNVNMDAYYAGGDPGFDPSMGVVLDPPPRWPGTVLIEDFTVEAGSGNPYTTGVGSNSYAWQFYTSASWGDIDVGVGGWVAFYASVNPSDDHFYVGINEGGFADKPWTLDVTDPDVDLGAGTGFVGVSLDARCTLDATGAHFKVWVHGAAEPASYQYDAPFTVGTIDEMMTPLYPSGYGPDKEQWLRCFVIQDTTYWNDASVLKHTGSVRAGQVTLIDSRCDNPPPSAIETFTRTVAAGNWGTSEFDGSPVWYIDAGSTPAAFSVDGTRGVIDMVDYAGGDPQAEVILGSFDGPIEVTGDLEIATTGDAAPSMEVPFLYIIQGSDPGGSWGNYASFEFTQTSSSNLQLGVTDQRTGSFTDVTNNVAGNMDSGSVDRPLASQALRFRARMDETGVHARVWDATTDEPSDWQAESVVAAGVTLDEFPTFQTIGCSAFSLETSPVTQFAYFDNLAVNYARNVSYGSQVILELVGTGDGTTTEFSTRYAYIPGSLEVFVDGLPETAITETDPTTGRFTFDGAPYSTEEIRATYLGTGS